MKLSLSHCIALGKAEAEVRETYDRCLESIQSIPETEGSEQLAEELTSDAIHALHRWTRTFAVTPNKRPNRRRRVISESDEIVLFGATCMTFGIALMTESESELFITSARPGYPHIIYEPISPE